MFTLVKCPNTKIKVIGAEISVPSGLGRLVGTFCGHLRTIQSIEIEWSLHLVARINRIYSDHFPFVFYFSWTFMDLLSHVTSRDVTWVACDFESASVILSKPDLKLKVECKI